MRAVIACVALLVLTGHPSYAQTDSVTTYLSDLVPSYATIGFGTIRKDLSVNGTPLRLNGVTYPKGLGTHAVSDIRYVLPGSCSRFNAVVGVDDWMTLGSIRFQVWVDGSMLYDSFSVVGENLTGSHPGLPVSVGLSGRRELRLLVTDGGDGIGKDHADWADAKVTCTPEAPTAVPATYLSDVPEAYATIGWGTLGKDVAVNRTPLRLNGVTFGKGLGTHAASEIRYALSGLCSRFQAVVGVDDAVVTTRGSIRFQVWADNAMLYDSFFVVGGNMTGAHPGQPVSVDISGRHELRLVVTDGGNGIGSDHADWADAKVTCTTSRDALNATFAYWNLAGGNGRPHLASTNLADAAKPFTCTSASGAPVDDSVYNNGSGAALLQSNGAMTAALDQHIASDPMVVAFGVGEAWGGANVQKVLSAIGWFPQNATTEHNGDAILTRYGFSEQAVGPVIGQTGAELHKPIYANVCLNKPCTRTIPLFVVHTQAAQGAYDASMATLLGYVDAMVPVGQPRVIIGDLNAWDTLTDPHLCVASTEPGASHEAGIRRVKDAGYTAMFRVRNPSGDAYTGMLNVLAYSQSATSCLARAGLPQGHPYKAVDHAFSKHIAESDIVAATKFGVPVGGFGNCAASDHLGLKITVRTR